MSANGFSSKDPELDVAGDEDEDEDELLHGDNVATAEVEDDVRVQFQRDVNEAWRLEQSKPKDKAARAEFIESRCHRWNKRTRDEEGNFLQFLAYQRSYQMCQQWVVARAVNLLPDLMGVLDKSKRTPLTVAICEGNRKFLVAICSNLGDEPWKILTRVLKNECNQDDIENGQTCLQAAISKTGLRQEHLLSIIRLAPEEMFSIVDLQGRTPLHLVVDYDRASSDQVHIVKELLNRAPAALRIRTSEMHGKYSVYQYHDKTRKDSFDRDRRANDKKQMKPPPAPAPSGGQRDGKSSGPIKKTDTIKASRSSKDSKQEPQVPGNPIPSSTAASTPTGREKSTNLTNLATSLEAVKGQSSPAAGKPPVKLEKTNEAVERRKAERQSSSNEIQRLLKLEYMHSMNPHEASEYLHLRNRSEKHLWYDFGPKPCQKVRKAEFKNQFDHLEFDEFLQYVAFPHIQLEDNTGRVGDFDEHHQGRQDMDFFFEWLKSKGVKRIMRVEVEDMETPSHSDQAIEAMLGAFEIEVLDWKRLDLDARTVRGAGRALREIFFYWSGRNSVLRSWSDQDYGLSQTNTLEKITIIQVEGIETKERTDENIEVFRKRLAGSWSANSKPPEIKYHKLYGGRAQPPDQSAEKTTTTSDTQERHVDPHKWMKSMERFAEAFRQINELGTRRADPALHPVTIALIDDGVDITHEDLQGLDGRNLPGRSFDYYREQGWWRVSPYWISVRGHGTLMARLIRRICPSAVIYVIKVRTIRTMNSNKLQIDPSSAIQAIKHATDIGAHIISMSWTTNPADNANDKLEFDKAIRKAGDKSILMFCAASDQGKFEDFTYPHASNPSLTFRIGAAKATGQVADFVGDNLSFVFPGHDVVLDSMYAGASYDHSFESFASHTGSSVATALAAGLAALIYECVRLGVIHTMNMQQMGTGSPIRASDLNLIRKKQEMETCMRSTGANQQSDKLYLEVWKRFEGPGLEIENGGSDEAQMATVTGLARLLLNRT